jgi:hypothetical protein
MTQAFEIHGSTTATTAIEFLLDETGSMWSIAKATIGGFNEYVSSQKKQPGECLFTLTKFDTTGVRTQYTDKNIQDVEYLNDTTYVPNSGTNLYDAIGERIKALENRVANYPTNTSILFIIMTDGDDTSSQEHNAASIKALIQVKEAAGWTFVYLGANQDAWKVGQTFGMSMGNTMSYAASASGMESAMNGLANATTAYRGLRSKGIVASASASTDFFGNQNKE